MARPDVDALRSQVSAAATDPELEPAERVSSLRRLRDLVDMARDQARASLRDQLELIDSLTAIIGSADTYIGDNELRRDAQGMDKALTLARMRENADLHERMVAQGVSPEDLADAGFLTHDEIDEAESDGTIEEAAFGLAARFREWMVKRDHGKFSKKNVAGDAPAAPAARPAAPAPAQRGARPKPFVPKPRPAQAARPAAPAPAAPAPAQKPLAADAAPDERATHPALPKSPGVLGMGKIKPEDMHAIDDDMRAMVKAGEDEKPKQNFNGADDLFKAATDAHGDVAWVVTRAQTLDEQWFGPVVSPPVQSRLGDVALVAFAPCSFEDPSDTGPYRLVCRHGSLTSAEMYVPLIAAPSRKGS